MIRTGLFVVALLCIAGRAFAGASPEPGPADEPTEEKLLLDYKGGSLLDLEHTLTDLLKARVALVDMSEDGQARSFPQYRAEFANHQELFETLVGGTRLGTIFVQPGYLVWQPEENEEKPDHSLDRPVDDVDNFVLPYVRAEATTAGALFEGLSKSANRPIETRTRPKEATIMLPITQTRAAPDSFEPIPSTPFLVRWHQIRLADAVDNAADAIGFYAMPAYIGYYYPSDDDPRLWSSMSDEKAAAVLTGLAARTLSDGQSIEQMREGYLTLVARLTPEQRMEGLYRGLKAYNTIFERIHAMAPQWQAGVYDAWAPLLEVMRDVYRSLPPDERPEFRARLEALVKAFGPVE